MKKKSCVLKAGALGLSLVTLPYAFAHGPQLGLEHYVRQKTLLAAEVISSQNVAGREADYFQTFQISNGKVLALSRDTLNVNSKIINWVPGTILAFVEGPVLKSQAEIFKEKKKHTTQGLYLLTTQEYAVLANDPHHYVVPVEQSATQTQLSLQKKTTINTEFFSENFTASAEDPLEIDAANLMSLVRKISGEDEVIVDGKPIKIIEKKSTAMRQAARSWMKSVYAGYGVTATENCYNRRSYQGCNVEATILGEDTTRFVYVTSHLDTVGVPGADDNGSGTSAVMELSRIISQKVAQGIKPKLSIKFVSFDQEELGLIGSKAYVASLDAEAIKGVVGVINMDMIGYDKDNDGALHAMDCDRADSKPLTLALDTAMADLNLNLKKVTACTNRSDHASFWNKGIPALIVSENFFGGDSNICYHKQCDTVDKLNVSYMNRVATLVANTVWNLVR